MNSNRTALVFGVGVLSCAAILVAAPRQQSKGEANCAAVVKALGLPPMTANATSRKQGDLTTLTWGKTSCAYDSEGHVRTAVDFVEFGAKPLGTPKIKNPQAAAEIAKGRLTGTGMKLREPALVSPPMPWPQDLKQVTVRGADTAFGKPTYGFTGGVSLMLSRYSGKVCALSWSDEFTADKPVVKIDDATAKKAADKLFAPIKEKGRAYSTRALLQYFKPSRNKATPEGKAFVDKRRIRYCWVVVLTYGPIVDPMAAPVGSVAVDAETGAVLAKP